MNKRLEYSSLIKKLISCESREQLSDTIKEINEFNKKYSITPRSEEFKKFEIVIGIMRVKLKRKHNIIENQLRSQKQNNKTNMKIIITESQYKILEMNASIKRRLKGVQIFLDNLMETMYPCDYDSVNHFMSGVISEARTYFNDVDDFQGMDKSDFLETLETHFEDEIYNYYLERCSDEEMNEDLGRWFKEKWVDVSKKVKGKHPPCGRKDADGKAYPKCRPSKKVSSETPKIASSYDKEDKKKMTQQKRRAEKKDPKVGTGNKPTMTSYKKK
jgi:hypothetical protein